MKNKLAVLAAAAIIAACGGGGGDSAPAPPSAAQGLWVGTTTTNRTVTALVLSDGTYYVLYSRVSNPAVIGGVIQGTSTDAGGSFTSGDMKDFNVEGSGVLSGSLAGTYTAKRTIGGTATYASGAKTIFSGTYDATYETVPSLAAVAGTYPGAVTFSLGTQAATVVVSSSGAISGGGNGCSITGTATPRTDGNAFNVSLTFGAAPCFFAGQTFAGLAYFNAATKRLYAAAPNAARTDGVLFVGSKP